MSMKTKVNRPVDGILMCIRDKGLPTEEMVFGPELNLVVTDGSEILRDLMFGDGSEVVTKMDFGDMNLDPNVDDIQNVAPPELSDTVLLNNLFTKPVASTKTVYGGHPAVRYEVTIEANEFNGSGQQLITEFGLFNVGDKMFSRKTRPAIFKDAESSLTFVWFLVFN